MTDKQKTAFEVMALVALMLLLTFLSGCSTMSIEYPEDKIDSIEVPGNVFVVWHDTNETIPMHKGSFVDGITVKSQRADFYVAHVIRGNACLFEHEIKHASGDMTHDGWSKYLMECKS